MNHASQKILIFTLLLGALLRFYGLNWGTDHQTGHFHRFHTDESTVIESASLIGVDIYQIKSSYGKAPMYVLWASTHIISPLFGIQPFDQKENASIQFTYVLARSISALLGVITIYLVFQIGLTLGGQWAGLLAAFFLAVCPGHIQQSHYFTVDPFLAFWVTLALYLTLRLPSSNWRLYLIFGIVCGLAAGTRLVGVWLAVPFFIAHLISKDENGRLSIRLKQTILPFFKGGPGGILPQIAITTAAGAITLLICEPFIILDPQHYFDTSDVRRFASSMRVAQGEIIRVWTLYDLNTTPFLFYLTDLLKYALGLPLELAALAGIALTFWKKNKPALLLLGWLIPYFLLVGGLHTKPIRYTAPMLPALTIFAAWFCVYAGSKIQSRSSLIPAIPAFLIVLPTLVYGLSIAQIYGREDSRIIAQRWISNNIPQGSYVLAEHGGFPTAWMVPDDQYNRQVTDSTFYINARDWMLPHSLIAFFQDRVSEANWIVLIEENRQKQFRSVPNHYPIAAAIYDRIDTGELGFERVAQFKNPTWFSNAKNAEPTLSAFDHPTVNIYKRKSEASPNAILGQWIESIKKDPAYPDKQIQTGVQAFLKQKWAQAHQAFNQTLTNHPKFVLPHLLIAETYLKQDDEASAQNHWDLATAQAGPISKYSFMGMIEAGLKSEGVIYLEDAAHKPGSDPNLRDLARATYNEIGQEYQQQGDHNKAAEAFARSIMLAPELPAAYVNTANSLIVIGDLDGAQTLLNKAITLDSTFAPTQQALARLYQQQNNLEGAYQTLTKSLELDPQNESHQAELFNLGSTYYQRGQTEMAYTIFQKILAHNPNFQEVHFNLGVLHLKSAAYNRALPHLIKATQLAPQDLDAHFALAGVYDALNRSDEARTHYRRVLDIAPNHGAAQTRLNQLNNP